MNSVWPNVSQSPLWLLPVQAAFADYASDQVECKLAALFLMPSISGGMYIASGLTLRSGISLCR
ncbi:hypothetical protein O9929_14970 [Vibrio lentus]|nr:hypothetical protein [Vibrio lentus]